MGRLTYEQLKLEVYQMEIQDVVRTSLAVEESGDLKIEGYSSKTWN